MSWNYLALHTPSRHTPNTITVLRHHQDKPIDNQAPHRHLQNTPLPSFMCPNSKNDKQSKNLVRTSLKPFSKPSDILQTLELCSDNLYTPPRLTTGTHHTPSRLLSGQKKLGATWCPNLGFSFGLRPLQNHFRLV